MDERKAQNQDKFVLRLPDGMRERVKAAADKNNRSMNAELVATLQEKYPEPAAQNLTIEEIQDYLLHLSDDEREVQLEKLFKQLESRKPSEPKLQQTAFFASTKKRA